MRNLTFIFLLISSFSFSQIITKDEVVKNEKGGFGITKTIDLKNGTNETVKTQLSAFGYYKNAENFDFQKFDGMIETAVIKAKSTLKSPSTFRPLKIMAALDEEKWSIIVHFSGQNGFGGTVESDSISEFDNGGKFIKQL